MQKIQSGFLPADPADDKALHPRQREQLDLYSRYKFALLDVLIRGWDIIKNAAICEGRPFPFANPRELFTQICRECANGSVEDMVSTGIDQAPTLNELRDSMTDSSAFFRKRLEERKHNKMLSLYYVLYAKALGIKICPADFRLQTSRVKHNELEFRGTTFSKPELQLFQFHFIEEQL